MVSDVQAVNDYGHLISACVRRAGVQVLADCDQLSAAFSQLRTIWGRMAGGESIPPVEMLARLNSGETDPDRLLRSIDDIRLRMIGVLLGAQAVSLDTGASLDSHLAKSLITEEGGLTWGIVGRTCVVLMPAIDGTRDSNDIGRDFLNVFEMAARTDVWVIDCSAVRKLPLMLLAVILGYRDCLADMGKRLSLVWLGESAVPEELFGRVERLFDLQKVGDFFFTRGVQR